MSFGGLNELRELLGDACGVLVFAWWIVMSEFLGEQCIVDWREEKWLVAYLGDGYEMLWVWVLIGLWVM